MEFVILVLRDRVLCHERIMERLNSNSSRKTPLQTNAPGSERAPKGKDL